MFPLPAIPMLPKIHTYFEVEQAKTFMKIFGIALLVQWFLPFGNGLWSWKLFGATMWQLLAGIGFTVLGFVPGLDEKLKPNLLFLIAAGAGVVGVLWSFAGAPTLFWTVGFGLIGLIATVSALILWSRNGFSQSSYMMLLGGLISFALGLLIPLGGTLPIIRIFSFGSGVWGVLLGIATILATLAFIALLVLLVMNVFLKKEDAEPVQVQRFASVLFVAALLFWLVCGVLALPALPTVLHSVVSVGIFAWLSIWGVVCFIEAKARGENLLAI